ncbi:hypothetical protein FE810_01000 [Thalassotalea litorea]|uniref:Phosphatase n=1 Tax=Thalassotalea litorea TaxID=2020715 RepID=A0A5R9IPU2_9GAMM|nr:protein tyrosine phosphatase family protein [Thalassotalea litorea]TLU67555.1 hypothetical protein FE810_01000 [Thalassotalea litorea]
MVKYLLHLFALTGLYLASVNLVTADETESYSRLSGLENFQVNNESMMSSGQPNQQQFEALQAIGVTKVIDLIPSDRSEESALMAKLGLTYHNIPVVWENPRVEDFEHYVTLMQLSDGNDGITLTHCKLNWRGAAFTYLYRVTQLNESEAIAKKDLLAIWQPDEIWQKFIDDVKAKY